MPPARAFNSEFGNTATVDWEVALPKSHMTRNWSVRTRAIRVRCIKLWLIVDDLWLEHAHIANLRRMFYRRLKLRASWRRIPVVFLRGMLTLFPRQLRLMLLLQIILNLWLFLKLRWRLFIGSEKLIERLKLGWVPCLRLWQEALNMFMFINAKCGARLQDPFLEFLMSSIA